MSKTKEIGTLNCQQAKDTINRKIPNFKEFVTNCLYNDDFVGAMNALLPFDKCVQSFLKIQDATSALKSMGLSIMRMNLNPSLFSLGISLIFEGCEENKTIGSTTFITACQTLEELRKTVETDAFLMQVRNSCEKQIDVFSSQSHDRKDGICDSY